MAEFERRVSSDVHKVAVDYNCRYFVRLDPWALRGLLARFEPIPGARGWEMHVALAYCLSAAPAVAYNMRPFRPINPHRYRLPIIHQPVSW